MSVQLSPCPRCQRHIRINEQSCPFCSAPIEVHSYTAGPNSFLRDQATAIFVGVTLAISGCETRPEQQVKPVPVNAEDPPSKQDPPSKPQPDVTPGPSTGSALVPPPTTNISPQPEAPAYGLAPKPRPAMKYGAPPPYKKPPKP